MIDRHMESQRIYIIVPTLSIVNFASIYEAHILERSYISATHDEARDNTQRESVIRRRYIDFDKIDERSRKDAYCIRRRHRSERREDIGHSTPSCSIIHRFFKVDRAY